MEDNMSQKVIDCFNNQDIDGMREFWHEDITIYDMYTNKILITGIEAVYQGNMKACLDPSRNMFANITKVGNLELLAKTFSHTTRRDVTLVEFVDGKIKNAWHASFEKE